MKISQKKVGSGRSQSKKVEENWSCCCYCYCYYLDFDEFVAERSVIVEQSKTGDMQGNQWKKLQKLLMKKMMKKEMYVNATLPMMKLITFVLTKMMIVVLHGNLLDFEVIVSIPNNLQRYLSSEKAVAAEVDAEVDYMIEEMVMVIALMLQTLIGTAKLLVLVLRLMMRLKWLILLWAVVAVVVVIIGRFQGN